MRKVFALVIASVMVIGLVGCGASDEAEEASSSMESGQTTTHEELEKIDFDAANFTSAEDGEVFIHTESEKTSSTSIQKDISPDEVWNEDEHASEREDFTLPEEVIVEGSLGTLCIPKIDLTVSIFETDDEMEAMVDGVAHFKETSCWNGNVGLAGHNQGINEYFGKLHTLVPGDVVLLETALGKRTYEVVHSFEISETDWSVLDRREENMITMITCVNHDLTKRLCVQAKEV